MKNKSAKTPKNSIGKKYIDETILITTA